MMIATTAERKEKAAPKPILKTRMLSAARSMKERDSPVPGRKTAYLRTFVVWTM